jgi:pectate lyase
MRARSLILVAVLAACAPVTEESAPTSMANRGAAPGGAATPGAGPAAAGAAAAGPMGWAAVADMGQDGTSGGGDAEPTIVTTRGDLQAALAGDEPRVVRVTGTINGSVDVGSNKTLEGAPGAVLRGHLEVDGSVNVIVRNLTIVGYNCADRDPCKKGADAVSVTGAAHHLWFDHDDISDGSDGNFDINAGSDYITISWTKFWYSSRRPGGHLYSNLLSSSDGDDQTDAGHLRVTFHHDWWADNVAERMPRVRFGKVHVFNSLYTAAGSHYCVGLGFDADLLIENNVFHGVARPFEATKYANEHSVLVARGNVSDAVGAVANVAGAGGFTPPYRYALEPAAAVEAAVKRGAGPH